MKPTIVAIIALATSVVLGGCGVKEPKTSQLLEAPNLVAMTALKDGGIRYVEKTTGEVWDVNKDGVRSSAALLKVEAATKDHPGPRGITVDDKNRTFVSWVDDAGRLAVGEVSATALPRLIWRSTDKAPNSADFFKEGRLGVTPQGRIVVSWHTKLLTVDPDGDVSQRENLISQGWSSTQAFAWGPGESLWIVDNDKGSAALSRAGEGGPSGTRVKGSGADASALTAYGEKELAACLTSTKKLQRFLITDGSSVAGRIVAKDCTGDVVQLKDGRLAYFAGSAIRVTAL